MSSTPEMSSSPVTSLSPETSSGTQVPLSPEMLYGTFYPQFDVPVILMWSFIILAGFGNWVVVWCFLRTKTLRNPFNVIVLALAFSNGISTTFVGPMQLSRVFVLYKPVTDTWCNIRIVVKTFCFNVSLLVIFTLAALRLYAGLSHKQLQLTYKKMVLIVFAIYVLSAASSPLLLDKSGSAYVNCMGQTDVDRLRALLYGSQNVSTEDYFMISTLPYVENGNTFKQVFNAESVSGTFSVTTLPTVNDSHISAENPRENNEVAKAPIKLWVYYFVMAISLFLATVVCYLTLVFVLRKHHNAIKDKMLTSSKNILTMKVTIYVTLSFFVSFLVPFFPGIIILPAQASVANLHYVAMFHCLSSFDAALTPLICYCTNPCFKNALQKSLPLGMRKVFCCRTTTVTPSSTQPAGSQNTNTVPQAMLSGTSHEPRREQF